MATATMLRAAAHTAQWYRPNQYRKAGKVLAAAQPGDLLRYVDSEQPGEPVILAVLARRGGDVLVYDPTIASAYVMELDQCRSLRTVHGSSDQYVPAEELCSVPAMVYGYPVYHLGQKVGTVTDAEELQAWQAACLPHVQLYRD